MTRLGRNIFEHDFGHTVYAVATSEKSSQRVAVQMYVVFNNGNISDITTITRKDIYTKKNCFDFFYEMEDFGRDDIDKIKNKVLDVLKDTGYRTVIQEKATWTEIHTDISKFIYLNADDVEEGKANDIFINGKYGYLTTSAMKVFIKLNEGLGYKRLDLLKRLKIMGALQSGKDRPYDTLVSLYGTKKRYYKIELAENVFDVAEEEVEVLAVATEEMKETAEATEEVEDITEATEEMEVMEDAD